MDMRLSRAFWPIALGVVGAGTIMAILSYGVAALVVLGTFCPGFA